jgi:hypothetical protein
MEQLTLGERQRLFTHNVSKLISCIYSWKYSCTFGEAYRTPEQAALYAHEGKGIKDSLHCQRLAIDINLFSPDGTYLTDSDDYSLFGKYWETLHPANEWGGHLTGGLIDGNHFEMHAS